MIKKLIGYGMLAVTAMAAPSLWHRIPKTSTYGNATKEST